MVAQIFTDIISIEIRVSWSSLTTGYACGHWFEVENEEVTFPRSDIDKTDRDLFRALQLAIRKCPEFTDAKRESKSSHLVVNNGNFPGVYVVNNPLNGSVYNVVIGEQKTVCECPDHQFRNIECKHIKAVLKHQQKASQPPLKLHSWGTGKLPSVGKLKAVHDYEISDEQLQTARESLGI